MMLIYILDYVTLIAIIIFIIFVIRVAILTIRYRKWLKFAAPATGIVGELKNVTCTYDRNGKVSSYRYNYALKITHGGQEFDNIYAEERKPGEMPVTRPGKKISILFSPCDHKYLQIAKTDEEIREVTKREYKFSVHTVLLMLNRRYFKSHRK